MRLIIQRVSEASVVVKQQTIAKINQGVLVLVGIEDEDAEEDIAWLAKKLVQMRIFSDEKGNMNWSCLDIKGEVLIVSQFTLHASTKKGNRPSFVKAAKPDKAKKLYHDFVNHLKTNYSIKIETGQFGAMMQVNLVNDGPVTIFIDSKNRS